MELPVLSVSLKWSLETIEPKAAVGIKLRFVSGNEVKKNRVGRSDLCLCVCVLF